MVNKATLIGNLGKDIELRYSQDGKPIAKTSLATSEKYNGQTRVEWHNLSFFGKVAEIAAKYLEKGSKVYIEGKIHYGSYEDRDGNKKYYTEIVVREMKMLDGKRESRNDNPYQQPQQPVERPVTQAQANFNPEGILPF